MDNDQRLAGPLDHIGMVLPDSGQLIGQRLIEGLYPLLS